MQTLTEVMSKFVARGFESRRFFDASYPISWGPTDHFHSGVADERPSMTTCCVCGDYADERKRLLHELHTLQAKNKSLETRIQHLEMDLRIKANQQEPGMGKTLQIEFDSKMNPSVSWIEDDSDRQHSVCSSPFRKFRRTVSPIQLTRDFRVGPTVEDSEQSSWSFLDETQEESQQD